MDYYQYNGSNLVHADAVLQVYLDLHAGAGLQGCYQDGTTTRQAVFDDRWEWRLKMLESSSRGDPVLTTSPDWRNVTQTALPYWFGDAVTPDMTGIFSSRTRRFRYRSKGRQKYRTYQRRKDAGDIIFTGYSVCDATIVERPGFDPRDVVNTRDFSYLRNLGYYEKNVNLSCNIHNKVYTPFGDKWVRAGNTTLPSDPSPKPYYATMRVNSNYTRYTLRKGALGVYPSHVSPGLPGAVDSFLRSLETLKPIKGLVTEVACEANLGAWDALTSFMEHLRETVPMIFRAIEKIFALTRSALGKVKHRRSLSSGNLSADIAGIWLWYRYAIQPLAMDLNAMLEALDFKFAEYQSYRKGRERVVQFEHDGWYGEITAVDRCLIRHMYDFHRLGHLTLDVKRTAWQLTPLFFVVDWAFNVGQVISAVSIPETVRTNRTQYSTRVNGVMKISNPDFPGEVYVDINAYSRGPIDQSPNIELEWRSKMNWKRTVDAWAIFWAGVKHPLRYR